MAHHTPPDRESVTIKESLMTFSGVIGELHAIADEVQTTFGPMSQDRLNWKPSTERWSVAECLEHLIAINSAYFPTLETIAAGRYRPTLQQRLPLLPRFFGWAVLKAVSPNSPRKFKTNKRFDPTASDVPGDVVIRFGRHQGELIAYIERTGGVDALRTIITSPAASVATYSLLDAYRIISAHERRHVNQARRVSAEPGFPKINGT
jgi:hypothetical protein